MPRFKVAGFWKFKTEDVDAWVGNGSVVSTHGESLEAMSSCQQ